MATGWLGWSRDEALHAPIPHIELALEGKIEFIKATNPFGNSEEPSEEERQDVLAAKMHAFMTQQMERQTRK